MTPETEPLEPQVTEAQQRLDRLNTSGELSADEYVQALRDRDR